MVQGVKAFDIKNHLNYQLLLAREAYESSDVATNLNQVSLLEDKIKRVQEVDPFEINFLYVATIHCINLKKIRIGFKHHFLIRFLNEESGEEQSVLKAIAENTDLEASSILLAEELPTWMEEFPNVKRYKVYFIGEELDEDSSVIKVYLDILEEAMFC